MIVTLVGALIASVTSAYPSKRMAKLYAEIDSDKGGRKASKGGEEYLDIDILSGNRRIACLTVRNNERGEVTVYNEFDEVVRVNEIKM